MRRGAGLIMVVGLTALAGGGGPSHHAAHLTTPYVVAMPALGTLADTCAFGHKVLSTFSAAKATATETVSVEGDDGQHLRLLTLNPPSDKLVAPPAPYH